MATNHYFDNMNHRPEQSLIDDLVRECIQIKGVDVFYLPRKYSDSKDDILGNDKLSYFDKAFPIDIYIESYDGFQGAGDIFSKFGLEFDDTLDISISKTTFENLVSNQIKNRPHEGDLLFLPFNKTLFEVRFVEEEKPFYQLGSKYMWKMKCEKFVYSHERFSTGYPDIDDKQKYTAYAVEIELGDGTGTYTIGETVVQSTNTAVVASWNAVSKVIVLQDLTGIILQEVGSANIIGQSSGADYEVSTYDEYDIPYDFIGQNSELEIEGNSVEDWSESNPFGLSNNY